MNSAERDMHIFAPELLSKTERTRDTIFTAIMWAFYLYLWVPLISLFAWLLGFEFAYDIMIRSGGVTHLAKVVWLYGGIVLVIFVVVTVWSLHNRLSYGHLRRRQAHDESSTEQIAGYFKIDARAVERLRSMRSAAIDFDAAGRPVVADTRRGTAGRPGPTSRN